MQCILISLSSCPLLLLHLYQSSLFVSLFSRLTIFGFVWGLGTHLVKPVIILELSSGVWCGHHGYRTEDKNILSFWMSVTNTPAMRIDSSKPLLHTFPAIDGLILVKKQCWHFQSWGHGFNGCVSTGTWHFSAFLPTFQLVASFGPVYSLHWALKRMA